MAEKVCVVGCGIKCVWGPWISRCESIPMALYGPQSVAKVALVAICHLRDSQGVLHLSTHLSFATGEPRGEAICVN